MTDAPDNKRSQRPHGLRLRQRLAAVLRALARLSRDQRGSAYTEYVVLTAVVALAMVVHYRGFNGILLDVSKQRVNELSAGVATGPSRPDPNPYGAPTGRPSRGGSGGIGGSGGSGGRGGSGGAGGRNRPPSNTPGQNAPGQNKPGQNKPGQNAPGQNAPGQNPRSQPGTNQPPPRPDTCDPAKGTCPGSGRCFAAGTPVYTADGDRPIETIVAGDWVWSRDESTGELALRQVLQTFITESAPVLALEVDGSAYSESLTVTPNHPFWVERVGWVDADQLAESALLSSPEGSLTGHRGAAWGARAKVYNFEVDEFHTYFVGEQHAWVHNAPKRGCADDGSGSGPNKKPKPGDTAQPAPKLNANGLTAQQERDFRTRIDNAQDQDTALKARYDRYVQSQKNLKKTPSSYTEWKKKYDIITENGDRGGRLEKDALNDLGVKNNNGANPTTYPSSYGNTRPDAVTGHAVVDVKSFPDTKNPDGSLRTVYLTEQLNAQAKGAHGDGKQHVVVVTNGNRDVVRPSTPLASTGSDAVLHRNSKTGQWAQWNTATNSWKNISAADAKTIVNGS